MTGRLLAAACHEHVVARCRWCQTEVSLKQCKRPYMDPSPLASTPLSGDEVRLLTYIRPRYDLGQPRSATMGYSRVGSSLLSRASRPWTFPGYSDAGSTCSPSLGMLATAVD